MSISKQRTLKAGALIFSLDLGPNHQGEKFELESMYRVIIESAQGVFWEPGQSNVFIHCC